MVMTTSSVSNTESQTYWATKLNKCLYQAEQQAKFINLQAEVDCLLRQLQDMKVQKSSDTSSLES
jgi:hypothetical protein